MVFRVRLALDKAASYSDALEQWAQDVSGDNSMLKLGKARWPAVSCVHRGL